MKYFSYAGFLPFFILYMLFSYPGKTLGQADSIIVPDTTVHTAGTAGEPGTDTVDIYEMTLEQLMNMKAHGLPTELEKIVNSLIASASKKPLSVRESPSIVSLVTEEEIRKSGARDLMDVLQLIPGMDFGLDVYGVAGLGIRGNWSHEGKVLLLWDGHEMNETLYGTLQFGNHFLVDHIKKVEVIRGPGSAIYGGYAEYGVINIVTKTAEELNGISVSGTYGRMEKTLGRKNILVSAGKKTGDFGVFASVYSGKGNRSDREAYDIEGNTFDMAGSSKLNPNNVSLGISCRNFSLKTMADKFITTSQDAYTTALSQPYPDDFHSYFLDAKNVMEVSDKFTITPRYTYIRQKPWNWEGPGNDEIEAYNKLTERNKAHLSLGYKITRKINLIGGGEYFRDFAQDLNGGHFSNGVSAMSFYNMAAFTEAVIKHRIVNLTIGARYDRHSNYGDAFNPRIAFTKKFDRFHFKALYARSFRAPSIENINYSLTGNILPEKTEVAEAEFGYTLTRKMILTANLFDITTRDPIIYYGISDTEQGYGEAEATGTRGIEADFRYKESWGFVNVNWAFYTASGKFQLETYEVPDNPSFHLAFPAHKLNLNSSYMITKNLSVNPSVLFRGKRYGYNSYDALTGEYIIKEFDPSIFLNLFISYEIKNLSAGLGVYNLLNQEMMIIQPYNSFHAPLPGPSREIIVKLGYNFNFRKKNV